MTYREKWIAAGLDPDERTPLPPDFPSIERLVNAGYWTIEDLESENASDLARIGLTRAETVSIFAALEDLDAIE